MVKNNKRKKKEILKEVRLEKQKKRIKPRGNFFATDSLPDWQSNVLSRVNDTDIFVFSGPPGTGKTFISVYLAVKLYSEGIVPKIYIVRPAVEAGEKLGYLPGTMLEKLHPYIIPIFEFLPKFGLNGPEMIRAGHLEIVPVAFCKGRTFNGFVLLDEAQDCTMKQLRLVLSRLGARGKLALTGDPGQSDCVEHPNAFSRFCAKLELERNQGIHYVPLNSSKIMRHELVPDLLRYCGG